MQNLTSGQFLFCGLPARFPPARQGSCWQMHLLHQSPLRWKCWDVECYHTPCSLIFTCTSAIHSWLPDNPLGYSVEMSRFKARLTSWSTHGACFPFLSLYCFVWTSSNERSRVFWLLDSLFHSLLLLINGNVIARLPGDVVAEEKIPLAGSPAWACLPDTCLETWLSQPPTAEPDAPHPLFPPKQ